MRCPFMVSNEIVHCDTDVKEPCLGKYSIGNIYNSLVKYLNIGISVKSIE